MEPVLLKLTLSLIGLLLVATAALQLWRWIDNWEARRAWDGLAAAPGDLPDRFDPAMLAGLPEPAARFFRFAIAPGTPLAAMAEIEMWG